MEMKLKQQILEYLGPRVTVCGFAPVERFSAAPDAHHPSQVCKDAQSVIVFGIKVSQGMLRSPAYSLHAMFRSYHSVYAELDNLSFSLTNYIESQGPYLAVPAPSYAPLVFHQVEPWGLLSLKHAAEQAGLGKFGRSGQLYHPEHGALLRFGAVVTNASLPGDPLISYEPCPPKCTACSKVCPTKAYDKDGNFEKMKCLGYCIKHAIYPFLLNSEAGLRNIERVINTAGNNYWLKCNECVKKCPRNKPKKVNAS